MILDKIFVIIKNNAKRLVKISFLSLFLLVPFINVSALSFSTISAGYGYTQTYNGVISNRTFNTFSSSNLLKYNYELPNSSDIDIDEFDFRFTISGNFQKDTNYIATFNWYSWNSQGDVFYNYFSHFANDVKCRVTNWNSTNENESACFTTWNVSGQNVNNEYVKVTFTFTPKKTFYGLTLYFTMPSPYDSYPSDGWEILNFEYTTVTSDSQDIINNQNQNTQNMINNQNNNTQSIINNQNQNTQNIINNQNQNTQDIINNNTACYDKTLYRSDTIETGSLWSTGQITSSNITWGVTDYLKIKSVNIISSSPYGTVYACFYNENKVLISCIPGNTAIGKVVLPSGTVYGRFSIRDNNVPVYRVNVCSGGQQAVTDTLTDSTPPDSSPIANATGWLPPGPVDSILNLPLTLMNSISNVVSSGTCQPITVDLPHISNTPLVIPCMSTVWENIGLSTFFAWFGRILGGIILYKYLVRLYKWVDDTLTMRENNNFDDGSMG